MLLTAFRSGYSGIPGFEVGKVLLGIVSWQEEVVDPIQFPESDLNDGLVAQLVALLHDPPLQELDLALQELDALLGRRLRLASVGVEAAHDRAGRRRHLRRSKDGQSRPKLGSKSAPNFSGFEKKSERNEEDSSTDVPLFFLKRSAFYKRYPCTALTAREEREGEKEGGGGKGEKEEKGEREKKRGREERK